MPELPEVETICRNLSNGNDCHPSLLGTCITGARVLWERSLDTPAVDKFLERLPGQSICEIKRRGKYLILRLSEDYLLVHLRMSGDIVVEPLGAALTPYCRTVLSLNNSYQLTFNDARKFGRLWLVNDPLEVVGNLGPEPLDDGFRAIDLYHRLHQFHRKLKPLLLDQSFLAGLGNIYTDEALHLSGLHPLTFSDWLNLADAERLWEAIRQTLIDAIQRNGSSIDWVYRGGNYQHSFRVYKRTGQPCPVCNAAIMRIVVGQRGTHFCPNCQPPPSS